MRRRPLLALLAAAPAHTRAQPALAQPALAQPTRTVTDGAGRRVPVPARVARVLPAGPPASILLWSLAPELMAGWARRPTPAELAFLPPEAAALPEAGRLTGRDNTANLEAVLAQRPDLVLDYGTAGPTYASLADRITAQTGLPDLLLDGALAQIPATYRLLGALLDREAAAERRATAAERLLAAAASASDALRAAGRPRVYYARGPRGTETALAGSISSEILEVVGAENVAARSAASGGLAATSAEQVLAWDPDWIIAADPRFAAAAATDPVWSAARAVRQGRIVVAPGLPFGWIDVPPSVNRLLGLAWLPVLFGVQPAEGLPATLAGLYRLLFGREPSPAELAPMLQAAFPRR